MDYEVEGVRLTAGVRLHKKIVRPNKYAKKMLWTTGNRRI